MTTPRGPATTGWSAARRSGRRAGVVVLWLGAVGVAGLLVRARLSGVEGFGDPGFDFWGYYVPAGRALASGGTPYGVYGYVYSPLIAAATVPVLATAWPLTAWTLLQLAAGLAAVVLAVLAVRDELPGWRTPVFAGFAVVTLLWSWSTWLSLALGQVELLVLVCLAAAMTADRRGHPAAAGTAVAVATLVKTWPAFSVLWLLRRGMRRRGRALAAVAVTLAAATAVFVSTLGPSVLGEWAAATRSGSMRPIVSYSAFGVGRELFAGGAGFEPFLRSPVLRWGVTGVLVLVALALVALVLRRPGDPRLALWHLVGCGLFLQPVNNLNYLLLLVPLVWLHAARLLDPSRRWRTSVASTLVAAAVLAWWVVAHRLFDQSRGGYLLTVAATVVMLAVSIVAEARTPGQTTRG